MTLPSTLRLKSPNGERSPPVIPASLRSKKVEEKQETPLQTFVENIKEVPTQAAKGAISGAASSVGNILDILGLQSKETLPGEKEKRSREFNVLEKMERGEVPSYGELLELSDDEVAPLYSRLPTTSEAREFLEEFGFPKAKRLAGRYAQRAGEFLGTPGGSAKAAIGSAIAGQTTEELGAPAWLQALTEIGTSLKLSKSKPPISSSSPKIQKELEGLKEVGFSDKDLTLARNALEDRGFLKKSSKYTRDAENRFKQTYSNVNKNFESIIEDSFPGMKTEGPEAFKKAAGDLYDNLDNYAREVTIKKPEVFVQSADRAIEEMERTLAKSSQKQEAIDILLNAKEMAMNRRVPGDFYTNFYKEMNSIGNWGNPKQREAAFGAVKNAIKDTFKAQGPEGVKLANSLEDANKAWMKYLNAEDISKVLERVSTEEGINFKKLHSALQKPDNMFVFKKGLGDKQAENVLKLSGIISEIGNLEKSIKGGLAKDLLGQGTIYGLSKAILTGDISSLKSIAGVQIAGNLATKLLTDPKYQNLALKMAEAAKEEKWNVVKSLSQAVEKKLKTDSALVEKVEPKNNPK